MGRDYRRRIGLWVLVITAAATPIGAVRAGILIGSDVRGDQMISIDTTTGKGTPLFSLGGRIVADLAYDPNHDVLYGATTTGNNLYRIQLATGGFTLIGTFPAGINLMHGLEYDSDNDLLYGITNQNGTRSLYQVNVTNAGLTLVGVHGIEGLNDLTYDPVSNVMYASEAHDPTDRMALRAINLATGTTTLIGNYNVPDAIQLGTGLAYEPGAGMFAVDNRASQEADDRLYSVNPATGQATLIGTLATGSPLENVLGLTFVPAIPEPAGGLLPLFAAAKLTRARRRRRAGGGKPVG